MADIKSGIFAKNVQKRINRAQEKVLQKLGKADETKDEQFEQVVINFRRQEFEGSRLQREMKSYMAAIKGMQQASINLSQSLHEVYEPDWHGKDDVLTIGKDCDALWEDFHNKVVDSTLLNLDAYLLHFPDLKNRVAKRSRKLIDYDSARHHVETLQASGMKNDRKMMKAEEELKQAQKVFDELNVSLQDELPTLWESRVDFYITTFKSVTSLESKFHREISLICKQLYEVMTKLGEQHSDKMFTIQGAPSDSGPLRLARTPSPPDDESPTESPDASSNHMLRPISPGPPRPKSPSQLKKGPPVPPPPKVTPTKEVAEEQIIDLFGGEFLPAPSPSQPNERPGESLLDLDFEAFQLDENVAPIPQTAVPWDIWSANSQPGQPAAEAGFVADWSADFGPMTADGDDAAGTLTAGPEEVQGEEQGGGHDWPPAGDAATLPQTQPSEPHTAAGDEVSSWEPNIQTDPNTDLSTVKEYAKKAGLEASGEDGTWQEDRRQSTPGLIFSNEYGEQIEESTDNRGDKWSRSPDGSGSEYETAEEWGDVDQSGILMNIDDKLLCEDWAAVNYSKQSRKIDRAAESEKWSLTADWSNTEDLLERHGAEKIYPSDTAQMSMTQPELIFVDTNRLDEASELADKNMFSTDHISGTQEAGAFESDPFAEAQGGGMFESDPFVEVQQGDTFESEPFTEVPGGGTFESDPFAEGQGGGTFESDPFVEVQGGDTFESDPFAEARRGGTFESDPFAEAQGGDTFESDPFAEARGGGTFESDPFAEGQGGGTFESDPFAEVQGGGMFESDPFAEVQGGDTFESDPFAEGQGGGTFESDPFAEAQGGGTFESVPFPEAQLTDIGGGFSFDPFAETSINRGFLADFNTVPIAQTTADKTPWDRFNNNFPASSTEPEAPVASLSGSPSEGMKGINVSRNHKEPENSDMSEDEAANRRYGKLYQELETEKDEVTNTFNGFSQDASTPSFFADFDKMDESAEATQPSQREANEVQEKLSGSPTGEMEEPTVPPAAEVDELPEMCTQGVEEPQQPPAGEADTTESFDSTKEEKLSESVSALDERKTSPADETVQEKMPIPSVVIEPASSNEGDDDHDADIISPTTISDNGVPTENQTIKHMSASGGASGLPDDFLYKVETMHDFEAANSDELELKRGDVVLVVPTASAEDQDAGWLTGIKESDWLTLGPGAQRGLFPENFTQRME